MVCGERRLTYGQLTDAAERVAGHLLAGGISQEDVVAVCCDDGADMIIGILGVLASGAAYLPLDPAYPPGRLALMLDDSGARAVLAPRRLMAQLGGSDAVAMFLEDALAAEPAALPVAIGPEALAPEALA
jgi:non-ribosomal peptide synthetase component F